MRRSTCEEDYTWNLSTCAVEYDKDSEISEYSKHYERIKILVNKQVVTCNEIVDTQENVQINHIDGTNYWLIAAVLLLIACLLLFVPILVKCGMKRGLTIPCLLSY